VSNEATRRIEAVHQETFAQHAPSGGLLGKLVPPFFQPRHQKLESLLVARRLILGTLLMTSSSDGGSLSWEAEEFVRRLRGSRYVETLGKKGNPIYVSKVGNQREFWLPTLAANAVLHVLLRDELLWLGSLNWEELAPANSSTIQEKIRGSRVLVQDRI